MSQHHFKDAKRCASLILNEGKDEAIFSWFRLGAFYHAQVMSMWLAKMQKDDLSLEEAKHYMDRRLEMLVAIDHEAIAKDMLEFPTYVPDFQKLEWTELIKCMMEQLRR